MPKILYDSEKKEIQFVTEQQKADALASHFEKIHQLTHRTVSVQETIVNETYDSYDTSEPFIEFNENIPANFKDNRNNVVDINSSYDIFTSTNELREIIKTRNGKKSSGDDQTSNFMLEKMPQSFVSALAVIMNHIINMHYIPSAWKL